MGAGKQPLMNRPKLRGAFLLLLAVGISALFLRMIQDFVLALLLAAVFAGLAAPAYRRVLDFVKGRRSLAAGITLLLGGVLIAAPLMGLLAVVADEAGEVAASVGPWSDQQLAQPSTLEQWLERVPGIDRLVPYQDAILAKASQLGGKVAGFAVTGLATGTRGTARFFVLLFIMLYAMFFFMREGRPILDRALRLLPVSEDDKLRMLDTFTSVTRATIKGTVVIGLVQGLLGGAGFAVAGIPGPVFWGMVIAVLAVIPGVGPAIIWVPAVIYLIVEGRLGAAAGLGVWSFAVVSTIDNVLRPVLVGKDTQLPDLLVLLGTLGGLALFGAVGIIVGPIIAALFVTIWELYGSAFDEIQASTGLGPPES